MVLLGAHLDSVAEGPGINDNGTGTARSSRSPSRSPRPPPRNPVRFACWGAEEAGLVGSTDYVAALSEEEGAKSAEPELDMSARRTSSASSTTGTARRSARRDRTARTTSSTPSRRTSRARGWRPTRRRSTALGLQAVHRHRDPGRRPVLGAEEVKTAEQQERFGGVVGEAFDRCYHQACDTFSNVSNAGLRQMADGAAHATGMFADRGELRGGRGVRQEPARASAARPTAKRAMTGLGHTDDAGAPADIGVVWEAGRAARLPRFKVGPSCSTASARSVLTARSTRVAADRRRASACEVDPHAVRAPGRQAAHVARTRAAGRTRPDTR